MRYEWRGMNDIYFFKPKIIRQKGLLSTSLTTNGYWVRCFQKFVRLCMDFEPVIPLTWSERFATVLLSPIVRLNLKPYLASCFL